MSTNTSTPPPLASPSLASSLNSSPSAPRNIIILLDGTGNEFSATNSNLIKLMSVLQVDEKQLVFYSSGLGTILPAGAGMWDGLKKSAAELLDEGLALNFDSFVCDAYKFLMDYYRAGDKIYLFGFSRGAYCARALAGMIQKVGLLPPGCHNQIKLAYEVYADTKKYQEEFAKLKPGKDEHGCEKQRDPAVLYRRIFGISRTVTIEFLGVWDTVSALGGISLPELPFAGGVSSVKIYRQALALDERRARFVPEYRKVDPAEKVLLDKVSDAQIDYIAATPADKEKTRAAMEAAKAALNKSYPVKVDLGNGKQMDKSKECWFMGCHSDVGGGNSLNDEPSLSNISFRWVLRDAVHCGLLLDPSGVALIPALTVDPSYLSTCGLTSSAVSALSKLHQLLDEQTCDASKEADQAKLVSAQWSLLGQAELSKVVEAAADLDTGKGKILNATGKGAMSKDVLSGIHESLTLKWQFLEHIPLISRMYTAKGSSNPDGWKINNGSGRQIVPHQKLHASVIRRLRFENDIGDKDNARPADSFKYDGPAAKIPVGWPTWEEIKSGKKALYADFIEA